MEQLLQAFLKELDLRGSFSRDQFIESCKGHLHERRNRECSAYQAGQYELRLLFGQICLRELSKDQGFKGT